MATGSRVGIRTRMQKAARGERLHGALGQGGDALTGLYRSPPSQSHDPRLAITHDDDIILSRVLILIGWVDTCPFEDSP